MAALKLLKTVKNAKMFQEGDEGPKVILIENVRLSFPAIGHMKEDEQDDGSIKKSYKATPMLLKSTHLEAKNLFVEIMNELMAAAKVKIPTEYKCIKDGDSTDREEYQGHWVIACSESRRPAARDAKGKLILDPKEITDGDEVEATLNKIDELFHSGVYVNILIRPWYFNGTAKGKTKTYPKRICAGVTAIQFFRDGPSFGTGRIDDSGIWGDSSNDDDDDGLGGNEVDDDDAL
jgi:hypothetical protein